MATNININLTVGLVAGFFGGLFLFFRGFRTYREYLRVQGTPKIPIRGISMGLVRIHGKAASERLVNSPVSHTPCCFYKVEIEKWKDEYERQSGTWQHYGSEADGGQFYLEDSSGRVLVDAHGAEFDLESNTAREVASLKPLNVDGSGASDAELLDYLDRVGPSPQVPGTRHFFEGERAAVAIERYIKHPTTPDELFQAMVPEEAQWRQQLEAEGPQSDPLSGEIRLAMMELYKHPFWSPEYQEGFKRVTKLQQQHRKEQSRIGAPAPLEPLPRPSDTGPRYRFTECCILPDHEYDIIGTCGENPEARDVNDRNLIRRDSNEPTYLISGLAGPDVDIMLQFRAQLMIFGGAMLAVFCLGLLLLLFGLF